MEREEGREERAENTGLAYVAGSLGVPKVWKSELQKLQNEVLRRPKALPEASWRSEAPIGTLWGRSLGALGSPLGAPGSLYMTVCMDLLRFKGPKASKMKSKWSLRREKRTEKREKSREEREESATEAKSARSL